MFSFFQHIVDFVYFLVYPDVLEPCELPSEPSSSEDCNFVARADACWLYGSTVVQSDTADKVLKIVNGKLDGYLEEINKDSKEKK